MAAPYKYLPSFGRRKGHRLRPSRINLFETLLPTLLIEKSEAPLPAGELGIGMRPLWFELGFGGGEHLADQAKRHPEVQFIGCEPYINGISTLLAEVDEHKLTNIRLHDGDAREVLERLPDGCLDRMFILFPDPWPKTRHHKRRVIQQPTLALIHRKLKNGGLLRIATDHADYGEWILEQMLLFNKFKWKAYSPEDWRKPPEDWVPTRYQQKAAAEGRPPLFLDFLK